LVCFKPVALPVDSTGSVALPPDLSPFIRMGFFYGFQIYGFGALSQFLIRFFGTSNSLWQYVATGWEIFAVVETEGSGG
jgi:hypothetical protein